MLKQIKSIDTKYQPYIGGTGPTPEQRKLNVQHLLSLINQAGIPARIIDAKNYFESKGMDYAEGEIVVEVGSSGNKENKIYIGYDRWGFVCNELFDEYNFDQVDDQTALKNIKQWYFGKKVSLKEVKSIENKLAGGKPGMPGFVDPDNTYDESTAPGGGWNGYNPEVTGSPKQTWSLHYTLKSDPGDLQSESGTGLDLLYSALGEIFANIEVDPSTIRLEVDNEID